MYIIPTRRVTRHRLPVSVGVGDLHDSSGGGCSGLVGNRRACIRTFIIIDSSALVYMGSIAGHDTVRRRESKIENILTVGRQRFIGDRRAKVHNLHLHNIRGRIVLLLHARIRGVVGGGGCRSSFIMTQI